MNTQAEKMVGDNTILLHLQCFKYVLVFITVQKRALVHSCQITKLILNDLQQILQSVCFAWAWLC